MLTEGVGYTPPDSVGVDSALPYNKPALICDQSIMLQLITMQIRESDFE